MCLFEKWLLLLFVVVVKCLPIVRGNRKCNLKPDKYKKKNDSECGKKNIKNLNNNDNFFFFVLNRKPETRS